MWGCRSVRVLQRQSCLSICGISTASPLKLYMIAGEASGDAIGAKVIRALQRQEQTRTLEFRGIGGSLMCKSGGFESLFPMQELSVMGFLEVVPHIWRFRRRIRDTLRDIEEFNPALVLTIDSKGFTFRVLKALQAREQKTGSNRIKKAHYVAPSVWAFKHRGKRNFTELKQLLDAMFTILPFEEDIFRAGEDNQGLQGSDDGKFNRSWCHFVGHPAVEDFLEANGAYDNKHSVLAIPDDYLPEDEVATGTDALLDLSKCDPVNLLARGRLFQMLAASGREPRVRDRVRENLGIAVNAFVICALVGSRTNEVEKSAQLVLDAIETFKRQNNLLHEEQIFVVFPTILAVEEQVNVRISAADLGVNCRVLTDLDAASRLQLFQSSDAAVAVSGTIALETTLASLPTVVVYRANLLTEWIARWLAAVRFVSVPNLLRGRPLIPELLFSDCTALNIAEALTRKLQRNPPKQRDTLELAMAASTLTKWLEPGEISATSSNVQPIRASDLAAKHILKVLAEK